MPKYEAKLTGYIYVRANAVNEAAAKNFIQRRLWELNDNDEINFDNMEFERVECIEPDDPEIHEFQVTCRHTLYYTTTVLAKDEDEAEELAADEAETVKLKHWEDDAGIEIVDCVKEEK